MRHFIILFLSVGLFLNLYSPQTKALEVSETIQKEKPDNAEVATFAGGCFWCLESEFRGLNGVLYTIVGYEGGDLANPLYKDVTTGNSGHAEAVEIYYDPNKITYKELLDHFLRKAHDPTQINRQGVDVGPQYRSAIFYSNEEQKLAAIEAIKTAEADKIWKKPIVTEILPKSKFWKAEDYHQQYYEKYKQETGRDHIRVILKEKKKHK